MTIVSSINARRPAYFSLDSCRNKDINKVKINVGNGFPHELVKFIVSFRLQQNHHDVVTEGIFRNGKRCDLIDLSSNIIYEVLNTEKIENIDLKQAKYPAKIYPLFVKDLNFIGSLDSLRNSYDKKLEI